MRNFIKENLLKVHYLIYSIPILLIGGVFFNFLKKVLPSFSNFIAFNPVEENVFFHHIPFFSAEKKEFIVLYIFLTVIAFLYLLTVLFLNNRFLALRTYDCIPKYFKKHSLTTISFEFLSSMIFSLLLFFLYQKTSNNFIFQDLINFITILMYFFLFLFMPVFSLISCWLGKKVFYLGLFSIAVNILVIFVPLICSKPYIMNTFFDLPTQTKLSSGVVNSIEFENKNKLQKFPKYDLRKDKGINSFNKNYQFEDHQNFIAKAINNYKKIQSEPFTYAKLPSEKEYVLSDNKDVKEYLAKKNSEIPLKLNDRFFFHHHNFLLGAVNEYHLRKPLNKINSQYGIGSVIICEKLLSLFGDINYSNYLRFIFSSYLLYALLALFMIYVLTKNRTYSVTVSLGIVFSYALVGYVVILMAPGNSPLRHFFDISALCTLGLLFKNKKDSFKYYALLIVFVLLNIFMSSSNGLMLALACAGSIGFDGLMGRFKRYRQIFYGLILLTGFVGFYVFITKFENNFLLKYYSNGLIGISGSVMIYAFFALLFFIGYAVILVFYKDIRSNMRLVFVGALFYLQEFCLYYLWMSNIDHFLHLLPIIIFYIVVLLLIIKELLYYRNYDQKIIDRLCSFALVYLSIASIFFLNFYVGAKYFYTKDSKYNVVYEWKNPKVKIISSVSEKFFDNVVALIKKYSPNQNGITIISKYDNIVPFMANKYSNFKYSDLQWMLVGEKEYNLVLGDIRDNKPEFIFVDTDVERDFENDYYPFLDDKFKHQAIMRIARLNKLKELFQSVKSEYKKVDSSDLITVWQRKK